MPRLFDGTPGGRPGGRRFGVVQARRLPRTADGTARSSGARSGRSESRGTAEWAHPAADAPALLRLLHESRELCITASTRRGALAVSSWPRSPTLPGASGINTCSRRAPGDGDRLKRFEFDKDFHVSPFMPMDMQYRWCFNRPRGGCSSICRTSGMASSCSTRPSPSMRSRSQPGALLRVLAGFPIHDVAGHRVHPLASAQAVVEAHPLLRASSARPRFEDPVKPSIIPASDVRSTPASAVSALTRLARTAPAARQLRKIRHGRLRLIDSRCGDETFGAVTRRVPRSR